MGILEVVLKEVVYGWYACTYENKTLTASGLCNKELWTLINLFFWFRIPEKDILYPCRNKCGAEKAGKDKNSPRWQSEWLSASQYHGWIARPGGATEDPWRSPAPGKWFWNNSTGKSLFMPTF